MVDLSGTRIESADLSVLRSLQDIEVLNLGDTSVTDDDLKQLGDLSKLNDLNLAGTRVTDLGMAALADLKSLKSLALNETAVTDRGLMKLVGLRNLDEPFLEGTQVTELGKARFRQARENVRSSNPTDSERGRHWNQLGWLALMGAHGNQAEQDRAVEMLERAVLESPNHDEYKLDLADAYVVLDLELTTAVATEIYEEVLERRPDDEDLLGRLAKAYTALENLERAFEYLERRIELVPPAGAFDAATQIVGIVAAQGKHEQALALMRKAAAKAPGDPRVQLLLAAMLVESGKPNDARAIAKDLLSRFGPENPVHESAESLLSNLDELQ
jgi:tetratricopeptide (TPR) repeat protein